MNKQRGRAICFFIASVLFLNLTDTFYTEIKTPEKMKTKLHAHVYPVVQNIPMSPVM